MKKICLCCAVLLFCSCTTKSALIEEEPTVQTTPESIPCTYSCVQGSPCQNVKQTPMVLKPRVTQIVSKKRPCCAKEDANMPQKEIIPDAPEIYVIAANRTTKSMIGDISPFLSEQKKVVMFVGETINNEADMPGGIEKGQGVIKRNLTNSEAVQITENRANADYVVTSEVTWFDTTTKKVPAIKYSVALYDNYGQKLGEWSEIIHQAEGDRSWW